MRKEDIKFTDIPTDWFDNLFLNNKIRQNIQEALKQPKNLIVESDRKKLGKFLLECIYSIPEYSRYQRVSRILLQSKYNRHISITLDRSIFGFGNGEEWKGHYHYYIDCSIGKSCDGKISIPIEDINNLMFTNISSLTRIDISDFVKTTETIPPELYNIFDNKDKLQDVLTCSSQLISRFSIDHQETLKQLYLNHLESCFRYSNDLNKYYDDKGFLSSVKKIKHLKLRHPELYNTVFNSNKIYFVDLFSKSEKGIELLKGSESIESQVEYIKAYIEHLKRV